MSKKLYDNQGRYIGSLEGNDDRGTVHDDQNRYKGEYNSSNDSTYDEQGRLVGYGDQRTNRLKDR